MTINAKLGPTNGSGTAVLEPLQGFSEGVHEATMVIDLIICDNHPAWAKGLASLIEAEAADLKVKGVAAGSDEAERMVRELLPDIVLMDVRMPDTGGIEATRRIRSASPTTKVVILTVSEEASDLYAALKAGASGYVLKERDVPEIADAVRSVHRGQLVIPAELVSRFVEDLDDTDPKALNDPEREILAALARGETNKEIALRMHVSERTVKRRLQDIYQKLHLADRLEATIYAVQKGLGSQGSRGP